MHDEEINVFKGSVETFGGPLRGYDKWLGGELGDDGNIYGVPGTGMCLENGTRSALLELSRIRVYDERLTNRFACLGSICACEQACACSFAQEGPCSKLILSPGRRRCWEEMSSEDLYALTNTAGSHNPPELLQSVNHSS
jgi:hypothetical protein